MRIPRPGPESLRRLRSHPLVSLLLLGAAGLSVPLVRTALAPAVAEIAVFGPVQMRAGQTYVEQFARPASASPATAYSLVLQNGSATGAERASEVVVTLNGSEVLRRGDLEGVGQLRVPLTLSEQNALTVRVRGAQGSWVKAAVVGRTDPTFAVFGPQRVTHASGPNTRVVHTFTLPAASGQPHSLVIANGNPDGSQRVEMAHVRLNGKMLLTPSDLGRDVAGLIREVSLLPGTNTVEVTVGRTVGSHLTIQFRATDVTAPELEVAAPAEGFATKQTEVEVAGTVTDQTAVQVEVNGVLASRSGDGFSVTVPLPKEGENTLTIEATDAAGLSATATRTVKRDTQAPALSVASPANALVTREALVSVSGTAQDASKVQVQANGTSLSVGEAGAFAGTVPLVEGINFVTVTATDAVGNAATEARQVTLDTRLPVITLTSPEEGSSTRGATVQLAGTVADATPLTVTLNGEPLSLSGGAFSRSVALEPGPNALTVTATDAAGNTASVTRTVTRTGAGGPLPPDPAEVAPALDPSVAATMAASVSFLYSGPNPIQTGVAEGTINPVRVAVLRGRVLDRQGEPIPGVRVRALDHPEYGQTLTREDGWFDLAVNGGGEVVIEYQKTGYLDSQRQVKTPWQDYVVAPEVVLVALDPIGTQVDLGSLTQIRVAEGSVQTDEAGTRQARVLFEPGTTAEMVMPDGSREALPAITVRATEYTVGENGPAAMPGELPALSAYTYAVELSVDEALVAGAAEVRFSKPVPFYVENFLAFPVGDPVPVGFYDRQKAAWVPMDNGRVIEITSVASGIAEIDVTGDGVADNPATLAVLGIDDAERRTLATLYAAGTELWRVQVDHFTPFDCNWPYDCEDADGDGIGDCPAPKEPEPRPEGVEQPECEEGSIIECQNQVLGERFALAGTPFTLNYRSTGARDFAADRNIDISLTGPTYESTLRGVLTRVTVAGRTFARDYAPAPNLRYGFTWDGRDAYGREVAGSVTATVEVGYKYRLVYVRPGPRAQRAFARMVADAGGVNGIGGDRRDQVVILWQRHTFRLARRPALGQGLGGWTFDAHHTLDPAGGFLYLGDGSRRTASARPPVIKRYAGGSGNPSAPAEGIPALEAHFGNLGGIAMGPDGSVWVAEITRHRVRRITPDGIIHLAIGSGTRGFAGDGGPASDAQLDTPYGMAFGPDGSLYIADTGNHRVRRVTPDGIITTVAGRGTGTGVPQDGVPATTSLLRSPRDVAVAPDGTVYIADTGNRRIRAVGTDSVITTIAGTGTQANGGDGGPAWRATFLTPMGVAVGPDGAVYVADEWASRIRRIGTNGIIETVAGAGSSAPLGDGGPATAARLHAPYDVAFDASGTMYIVDTSNQRIRRVGQDGIISTISGSGAFHGGGDGGPATAAGMENPHSLAISPDGIFYVADGGHVIRRIESGMPGFSAANVTMASEDGSQLYEFDPVGRHLRTVSTLTGATVHAFAYDAAGRLAAITDAYGLTTRVERDPASGTPSAIVAPFGQRTELALDANGWLAAIRHPAGEREQLAYTAGGLLTGYTDPRSGEHAFAYDPMGRLTRDDDPAGGFQALERTAQLDGFTVRHTTALDRATLFQMEFPRAGGVKRTITYPDGRRLQEVQTSAVQSTVTFPDGTTQTFTEGPDPRFAMQSPFAQSVVLRTPGGRTATVTRSRTATLADPNNPLSLKLQSEAVTLNGRRWLDSYDAATRVHTRNTPAGRVATLRLDSLGRATEAKFPAMQAIAFTFNEKGQLTREQQAARAWHYSYDAAGNLREETDPMSRVTSYAYDPNGRLTAATLPGGRPVSFGYDEHGNLTSVRTPGGAVHAFSYTPADGLGGYTAPLAGDAGRQTTFTYNLDRELTKILFPDGGALDYSYAANGRLEAITSPRGRVEYGYDDAGRITSVAAPGGERLAYGYDGLLRTSETWSGTVSGTVELGWDNNLRVGSVAVNGSSVALGYDNDGLITSAGQLSITRAAASGFITATTLGGIGTSHTYNAYGEPETFRAARGTATLLNTAYVRDALGRITRREETVLGATTVYEYAYDPAGRLREVKRDGAVAATYEFDANGNRERVVTPNGTLAGEYDAQDRLLSYGGTTFAYNPNGQMASRTGEAGTTRYTYDLAGNLTSVVLPGGRRIEYLVDGWNRRIGRKVDGALVQGFLYLDQLRPAAELDGAGQVVSRFVYAAESHAPVYMERGGVAYRLVTDHLGSIRLVVNASTGEVAQRIDYDEFGRVLQDTNPGFQPFGFAGGLYDRETGLVRFGARDYDAFIGRWTARDPIGFEGGDTNLYGYVLQDPVNAVDPTGFACETFSGRLRSNWNINNRMVNGSIGKGVKFVGGVIATGFVAKAIGGSTLFQSAGRIMLWQRTGFMAARGFAAAALTQEALVIGTTMAVKAVAVGAALEVGLMAGSVLEAGAVSAWDSLFNPECDGKKCK